MLYALLLIAKLLLIILMTFCTEVVTQHLFRVSLRLCIVTTVHQQRMCTQTTMFESVSAYKTISRFVIVAWIEYFSCIYLWHECMFNVSCGVITLGYIVYTFVLTLCAVINAYSRQAVPVCLISVHF